MVRFFPVFFSANSRKARVVILAFVWILGLFCGSGAVVSADSSFLSLMHLAPVAPMSIVGLLISAYFPLLFSVIAVCYFPQQILIPFAFLRAFLLSFVMTGAALAHGSAGWIVNLLFLFTDVLSTPFFLWYLIHDSGSSKRQIRNGVLILFLMIPIGYLDFRFVSPFLATILSM